MNDIEVKDKEMKRGYSEKNCQGPKGNRKT